MKIAEDDAHFYVHFQRILPYHQMLLRDEARNALYFKALKRHVTSESRVLDIGAGSGVWAVAAAKLGAKKATAVEADSTMIPVIQAHARENGVADRVEIVNGRSTEINLRHKFDVIVTETIGNKAFEENIVSTIIDARRRFLARGGVVIPQKVALAAAPAHLKAEIETPQGVPLKTEYIKNLALNITTKIEDKSHLEILGEAQKLLEVDLRAVEREPDYKGLTGKWNLADVSRANVFALWAQSELADGVELDTWNTISWTPVVCRFQPFALKKGELEFSLSLNEKQYYWTVSAPGEKPQSYTPYFAYAKLKLDSKFAPRKRKPRKNPDAAD